MISYDFASWVVEWIWQLVGRIACFWAVRSLLDVELASWDSVSNMWDVSMILLAQSANIWLRQLPTSLPVSHSKTTHCYTSHFTHLDTIQLQSNSPSSFPSQATGFSSGKSPIIESVPCHVLRSSVWKGPTPVKRCGIRWTCCWRGIVASGEPWWLHPQRDGGKYDHPPGKHTKNCGKSQCC